MVLLDDDREFWGKQITEHLLFQSLGYENENSKKEEYKAEARKKYLLWKNASSWSDSRWIKEAEDVVRFQKDVISKLDSKQWQGWLFPMFVEHITTETEYAIKKVKREDVSDLEEITFWNHINAEHAAFDAHLLDPSQKKLINLAYSIEDKIEDLSPCHKMFIILSLEYAEELDKYHEAAEKLNPPSIIHPKLLKHVQREGRRSIEVLSMVGQNDIHIKC